MKTTVIYSRVSTQEQSFQSQIDDLQKYAEYANLQIVGIFAEKVSGYNLLAERTEYDKMKEYVISNSVELIVCWELSRFGRNSLHTLNEIDYFKKNNVDIYFKKENIFTLSNDPMAKLVLNLLSSIAELERQTIVQRSERGRTSAAVKGKRTGFLIMPYGFKSIDGYITIDIEEAKNVIIMYDMASHGFSLRAIANKLNSMNVQTRKASLGKKKTLRNGTETDILWKTNTLRKILKSTLYKGERNYKGGIVIQIPQIITEEVWNKTQEIFESHIGCVNNTKYDYLFKGKMYCGKCGYLIGTRTERRYANLPSYYFCQSKKETHCNCGQFDSKVFDEMIFTQLFKNTSLMEKLYEDISKQFNLEEKESQIRYFKGKIIEQAAKKKRVNNLYKDGYLNDLEIRQEHTGIRNETIEMENNITKLETEISNHNSTNIPQMIGRMVRENNFIIKREFIEKFVNKILLYSVDKYDIDFTKLSYSDFWKDGTKQLKNPHGNDKLIYIELFAFDNPNPLKVTLTNVSKQCYIDDKLAYSEGQLSIV
jgi:site-specific DNA recombinase